MNKYTLKNKMYENYKNILRDMTPSEREWAEKFESMEYAIERGKSKEALIIAAELKSKPLSEQFIDDVKEHAAAKERCNPVTMESQTKRRKAERKTEQTRTSNMYDASDYVRNGGYYIDEDGSETEIGVTISPEDSLIDMIDLARAHKTDIENYFNNPKLWEEKPKAKGRPKKLESV